MVKAAKIAISTLELSLLSIKIYFAAIFYLRVSKSSRVVWKAVLYIIIYIVRDTVNFEFEILYFKAMDVLMVRSKICQLHVVMFFVRYTLLQTFYNYANCLSLVLENVFNIFLKLRMIMLNKTNSC